jgi:Tfp pilus assembly protein PilX
MAMEAAETAMRDAERDIAPVGGGSRISGNIGFLCGCGNAPANRGLCLPADLPICAAGAANPAPLWTTDVLDAGNARNVPIGTYTGDPGIALNKAGGGVTTVGGVAAAPRYVIEAIDEGGAGSGGTQNGQGSPLCSKKLPGCGSYHYRITASGTGPVANTRMDVQEIYRP